MRDNELSALVSTLRDTTVRDELERLRAEGSRPSPTQMEALIAEASRGRVDPGFADLVESYRRGDAPVSLLLVHPRMHEALRRRIEQVGPVTG